MDYGFELCECLLAESVSTMLIIPPPPVREAGISIERPCVYNNFAALRLDPCCSILFYRNYYKITFKRLLLFMVGSLLHAHKPFHANCSLIST